MVLLYNKASKVLKTKDYSKLFLWSAKYFLDLGVLWPNQKNQIKKIIAFSIHISVLIFVCTGLILYAYKNSHDFNKATYALCILCLPVSALYKILFIWYKSKDLTLLFNSVFVDFWPYDIIEAENIDLALKSFKYQSIFVIVFYSTGIFYVLAGCAIPLFQKEKTLIILCDYPFDWTVFPIYECIYFAQAFALGVSMLMSMGGVDLFVLGILLGSSYQYCILEHCFSAFNTNKMDALNQKMRKVLCDRLEKKYEEKKEFFVRLVLHHQKLLRCTDLISKIFSPMELGQLLFTVYAICFGIFRITTAENASLLDMIIFPLWIIGYLLQLSIDCFLGTFLYNQASLLPTTIFESNWVNLENKEFKKDIMFMIQHTQRIPQFSTYNLYDLNILSFGKVLKLSFSMYTVLSSLGK